mmetsp:Transcript_95596/g.270623  ORF Transcript_95596/g.270623 Transcript_95596/m.270623 type:complete len:118 (-) Transcript_95596:124-477(-)
MASFMFYGFLRVQTPNYEDRVEHEIEGPKLRNLWMDMENTCFQKYCDEVNDDQRGVHVYQLLKQEVGKCKSLIRHDNRTEVMRECTSHIVSLYKRCKDPSASSFANAPPKPAPSLAE